MLYTGIGVQTTPTRAPAKPIDPEARSRVRDLERRLNRVELVNQALWELMRDAAKLDPALLEARIREIDLRDGVEDGAITVIPLRCPTCKRVSSSKHWKCLYCGQEFDRGAY
jgi:hypothetical protein